VVQLVSMRHLFSLGATVLWCTYTCACMIGCRTSPDTKDDGPASGSDCGNPTDPAVLPLLGSSPSLLLEDGAVLSVVQGLQGGFHTYLSVQAQGMAVGADNLMEGMSDESLPVTHWEILAPDGAVTVEQEHWTVAEGTPEQWVTGPHLVVMQYFEVPPASGFDRLEREEALESMELDLSLRVVDHCGRQASTSRTVWLEFEEGEPDEDNDSGD